MQAFKNLDAVAAPIARPNVDTDQIVPARFLRKPRNLGFGNYLFHDLRLDKDGRERDFVLNKPAYRDAKILVAERNFGCGSSREAAPISIKMTGVKVVIAHSFARIFYRNAINVGLLALESPAAAAGTVAGDLLEVDAAAGTITVAAPIPGGGKQTLRSPFRGDAVVYLWPTN